MERLKELDDKIAAAIGKVKALKEEKAVLQDRVNELERALSEKDDETQRLASEKTVIRDQIEGLLNELETIET